MIMRDINPNVDLLTELNTASVVLAVGSSPVATTKPIVYVGSDGWIVHVSPDAPVGSGGTRNAFGAGAAACFGTANVFRVIFADYLPTGGVLDSFSMSTLDLVPNARNPVNVELPRINLGECFLVGVGAIGNATVWVLARTPDLTGDLHLIDHECVDLGNLQRYVLTKQGDVGRLKVELGADALADTDVHVHKHDKKWGTYLQGRADWELERVAVAVDTGEDRMTVQAALPRWIVNAWTQPGDLGVSRHKFVDESACLMCLYLPDKEMPSQDQIVAEAIGLSEERMLVRHLLHTGQPIDRGLIERIAVALQVPFESLLRFDGQPLQAFYQRAVCGGMVLQLQRAAGATNREAPVPLAFQSALAGILLAVELVAHVGNLRESLPLTKTVLDVLRPLGQELSLPIGKHPSGRCICQDQDYVTQYRRKYEPQSSYLS
jgi:hypothetical protein